MNNSLKSMVTSYFDAHPDAKDGVKKAYAAYHQPKEEDGAHHFASSLRSGVCHWCGRTREQVRHDELPPECEFHQQPLEVEAVLREEESMFFRLVEKGERDIPRLIERLGLTGKTLAILHHTHGYDIESVESVIGDVGIHLRADYEKEMESERIKSRNAQQREIIKARTA